MSLLSRVKRLEAMRPTIPSYEALVEKAERRGIESLTNEELDILIAEGDRMEAEAGKGKERE